MRLPCAALFFTATLFLIISVSVFAAVPEPAAKSRRERGAFRDHLKRGLATLGEDRNYRLLIATRIMLAATMIGQVVFIPYALKGLALPESIVGVLMIMAACFALPSNFLWSHLSDHYGNRRLLLVAVNICLAAPVCAIASSYAPGWRPVDLLPDSYDLRALLFILAFIMGAIGARGCFMGTTNYLLEIAPEDRRPSYMAFMRVLQAPTLLMPLVGGTIAEWVSFQATFILACAAGLGTLLLIVRLDEPRQVESTELR